MLCVVVIEVGVQAGFATSNRRAGGMVELQCPEDARNEILPGLQFQRCSGQENVRHSKPMRVAVLQGELVADECAEGNLDALESFAA